MAKDNHLFDKEFGLSPKIKKAQGMYFETIDGKRFLDFASATFNLSLGYNHPEVLEAVKRQMNAVSYASTTFSMDIVMDFAEKIVKLCPPNLTKVHPKCTGGSIANEGAIKAALKITGRNDIMSFYYGYHGQTYLMQAITGYHSQRNNFPPIGLNIIRIPFPYCFRCFFGKKYPECDIFCLKQISHIIDVSSTNGPACLIMEPILGIGGCVVPPKKYVSKLGKFCKEKNIPVIIDEVMTGIGRTGKMFAFEHFDIIPNMITLGKGLGGSGFGSAALITEERFTELTDYEHSFTASNFLISIAAANKTLELIEKFHLIDNADKMGRLIVKKLQQLKKRFSFIGDIRGLGLMQGIEIVDNSEPDPKRASRIVQKAMDNGLFLRCYPHALANTILITPPLIISEDQVDEGIVILENVLKSEIYEN